MAVLVFMPDITVNAQPDPGGQGSDGQIPIEVEGEGPDTETTPEEQSPEEQETIPGQGPNNQSRVQLVTEQSLIESGCQRHNTSEEGEVFVWVEYRCGGEVWACLASPDRADARQVSLANEEIRRGECVYRGKILPAEIIEPTEKAEIKAPTENSQSSREINVKKIIEPASSDSQGESGQQQANGDVAQVDEEAQGEEDKGEENNASNQSQDNADSKEGYGCSASS